MQDQLIPHIKISSTEMKEKARSGLRWERLFGSGDPFEGIEWDVRDARITKGDGKVVFEQKDVEVPNFWSQTATDIVASKYFRGRLGTPERETSVKQMIDRVAKTIGYWGLKDSYFESAMDCENFVMDLRHLLVHQYFSFNSPVWFNVGEYERPQCSACFILSVDDTMDSILNWCAEEGRIFKFGSGAGTNLSNLRSSKEQLSRGGYSSGPVSFMKAADGIANSIKSGGTTRRAAKMVVLNVDHPDIKDFIYCKKVIEDMTKALARSGIKDSITGDIFDPYTLLPYQNANNSVRVNDEFMRAVEADGYWSLKAIKTGEEMESVRARDVLRWMADAAWHSADPGVQYDTTINDWHTCPNAGRINASNPCSEYMHIDNSACNLASLNLMRFLKEGGKFDVDNFRRAVDTVITAQDIIVGNSSYPTPKITENANNYRQLGLGYANLGALLMVLGLPYDSEKGRILAGEITSLMTGEAYRMSALLSDVKGPFAGYEKDKEGMLNVLKMHLNEAEKLHNHSKGFGTTDPYLHVSSRTVWHEVNELAEKYGVRNSQATVLAPTGTISFMMDCDTTGIEPELALVKYKKLVGGGTLKLVNGLVPLALRRLGYTNDEVDSISGYIIEKGMAEGAPGLKSEHQAIFDCSFTAPEGTRSIHYMGHIRMMAAAQPFISGAISKTINMPFDATVEDIEHVFIEGWRLGIKALAVYRDGCKSVQPLNTSDTDKVKEEKVEARVDVVETPSLVEHINGYTRVKLPAERPAINHKFEVGGFEGYLTVGFYPGTNKPGETFLVAAKEGSTISGLFDTIATLISMCLQSGIPLKTLVKKFKDTRFEPMGFTSNDQIPAAKSIIDYVFRYMGMKYLNQEDREEIFGPDAALMPEPDLNEPVSTSQPVEIAVQETIVMEEIKISTSPVQKKVQTDAPVCQCGTLMVRAGSCYSCPNCFASTGVCN